MKLDEAIALTIGILRDGRAKQYGYDLYPPQVARAFVERARDIPDSARLHGCSLGTMSTRIGSTRSEKYR
jgi:hypothetical protein